jgi:hypothetical protein
MWTAVGPLACGEWPAPQDLGAGHRLRTLEDLDDVLAGLYTVADAVGNLRWLGKAHRDGGVGARACETIWPIPSGLESSPRYMW